MDSTSLRKKRSARRSSYKRLAGLIEALGASHTTRTSVPSPHLARPPDLSSLTVLLPPAHPDSPPFLGAVLWRPLQEPGRCPRSDVLDLGEKWRGVGDGSGEVGEEVPCLSGVRVGLGRKFGCTARENWRKGEGERRRTTRWSLLLTRARLSSSSQHLDRINSNDGPAKPPGYEEQLQVPPASLHTSPRNRHDLLAPAHLHDEQR